MEDAIDYGWSIYSFLTGQDMYKIEECRTATDDMIDLHTGIVIDYFVRMRLTTCSD